VNVDIGRLAVTGTTNIVASGTLASDVVFSEVEIASGGVLNVSLSNSAGMTIEDLSLPCGTSTHSLPVGVIVLNYKERCAIEFPSPGTISVHADVPGTNRTEFTVDVIANEAYKLTLSTNRNDNHLRSGSDLLLAYTTQDGGWGYSLNGSGLRPVHANTSPEIIADLPNYSSSEPTFCLDCVRDTYLFSFGARVHPTQALGAYSGRVVWTVVAAGL
jgi:hypothetical protein